MPPNKRPDAETVRRKKRLIALKYDRDPKRGTRGKPDLSAVRVKDLMRLLHHRMQQSSIPDDSLAWHVHGREISRVIISHLARMPNASERIRTVHRRAKGIPPRAKYESESLTKAQPWKTEGISRAAWYARRKRDRA